MNRISIVILLCGVIGCGAGSGGGTIQVTMSGEAYGVRGLAFPAINPGDPVLLDGWDIQFSEILVTVDKIKLSEEPDRSPSDQSMTGKQVAEADGPWAVDVHKGGPLLGKAGNGEQAVLITTIENQNLNGHAPFDNTMRYAFGFDFIPAKASAKNVNLDAQGMTDYQTMIANGWDSYYVGTATLKSATSCITSDPTFDYTKLPGTVSFKWGFHTPTTYINCQNPDNDPAPGLNGEDHERGIQVKSNAVSTAQITFHTDHPFFDQTLEGGPLEFFGQYAALAINGESSLTQLSAANPEQLPTPWRSCNSAMTPPDHNPRMDFNLMGVPYKTTASSATSLQNYGEFMDYTVSEHGHLNSDGYCYVARNYPSPP